MPHSPELDMPRLQALCDAIDRAVEGDAAILERVAPVVSNWSAAQHIAHSTLANELVLRNVQSLVRESGLLVIRGGEPLPIALQVLESGRIPRGEAQAPRMVRPPDAVDRAMLLRWIGDVRRELDSIDPRAIVASELRIPHQLLGPLDAPQWMRFAVVHTRHHLEIASEVLQAHGGEVLVLPEI